MGKRGPKANPEGDHAVIKSFSCSKSWWERFSRLVERDRSDFIRRAVEREMERDGLTAPAPPEEQENPDAP